MDNTDYSQELCLEQLFGQREYHIKKINDWITRNRGSNEKIILLGEDVNYNIDSISDESLEKIYNLYINNEIFEYSSDFEAKVSGYYWYKHRNFSRALQCYLNMSSPDEDVIHKIAVCYYNRGNYDSMIEWYEKGIKHEQMDCILGLANYYRYNISASKAFSYYKLAYTNGHLESILDLAYCCQKREDYKEARKWYKIGIEKGVDSCMIALTDHYYNAGKIEKMKALYEKEIANNNVEAMKKLASFYGDHGDPGLMEMYYRMAIDHGDVAMIGQLINYFYRKGDYGKMEEYYLMKIKNSTGQDEIKEIKNLIGTFNKVKEYLRTIQYYEMLIEKGHVEELYNIATIYKTLHQPHKEMECYQRAMDKKIDGAFRKMGSYYYNMVPPNYPEAIKYYIQSCVICEEKEDKTKRKSFGRSALETSKRYLNDALQKHPDLRLINKARPYLNKATHHKLNMMIVNFIKLYKYGILNELNKAECCICLEENEFIVDTICPCKSSGVCAECYEQIKECPFCQDPINE